MSNITRPQSPVPMEGHIPKMSSSPPKAASGWPSLNPAHKKGTLFRPTADNSLGFNSVVTVYPVSVSADAL